MTTKDLQQLIDQRDRDFNAWFRSEAGPRWCIAARTTPRLVERYGRVITPRQAEKMREAWEAENPVQF